MDKLKTTNIRRSLIFTFCLLILIFIFYGLLSLFDHNTIFNLTKTIYDHPLVVSNAALHSDASIAKMHRSMKDVVLSKSSKGIQNSIKAVEQQEKKVYQYLDIVKNQIIGAEGKKLENEARKLFENWHSIRKEVINLVISGQIDEGANITVQKGADHVAKLESKMHELTSYARTKASLFMTDSENTYSKLIVKSIMFLLLGTLISSLIAFYTIKQILFYEKDIRDSQERYRSLVESQIDFVSRFSSNGTFTYVNEVFCRFFNKTREDLIGSKWQPLPVDDDSDIIEKKLSLLSPAHTSVSIENRVRSGEGNIHWIQFINTGFFDLNGNLTEIQSVGRDITERKQAEEQIKASLEEKEALLRELYHRTKNNMQVIISLINLQIKDITDENILQMFQATKNRINSMSLVHEKLYQTKNLSRIDLKDYFLELISLLSNSFQDESEKIKIKTDMNEAMVTVDSAIPCGLIMNELVTNIFKHAFPENHSGEIQISLKKSDNGKIEFMVSDNGVGLPLELDIRDVGTLGLKSVVALAEHQLPGSIKVVTDKGTKFYITFKELLRKERI